MKLTKTPFGEKYIEINSESEITKIKQEFTNGNYPIRIAGRFPKEKFDEFLSQFGGTKKLSVINEIAIENDFLYELKQLEELGLHFYSDVKTIVDLEKIVSLKHFGFNYYKKYIKNLCSQTVLQTLSISDYTEKDMRALSCLTSIKEFRTVGGKMKSLEGIQHLTNLEKLEISAHRSLTDISQIVALQNLKYLEINTCWKMADFSPIGKLKSLRKLRIIDCKNLESIEFVKELSNLEFLSTLGTTIINDYDTTPAAHVPVFFGSQNNKYNKQYPEKEIHKSLKDL